MTSDQKMDQNQKLLYIIQMFLSDQIIVRVNPISRKECFRNIRELKNIIKRKRKQKQNKDKSNSIIDNTKKKYY